MQGNTMARFKNLDQSIVMYSTLLIGFAGSALAGVPAPPPRTGGAHPEHKTQIFEDGRSARRLGAVIGEITGLSMRLSMLAISIINKRRGAIST